MTNSIQNQSKGKLSWQQALTVLLLLSISILVMYRETAAGIVNIWMRSDAFTHGFLVPPIVLWLVWRRRSVLIQFTPQPNWWGLVGFSCAAFAWLLGDLVAVNTLTQLAFVSMLVLLVPTVFGGKVARALIFPLAFMFFSVPFGEFAMPQLMMWTADFTVLALRLTGIPVYREGLQFVIPTGNWSVVEACSGVRYLIASVTVGTLFAYLNYQSTRRRVLFIIVSFLVPVLANWLRAYIIVLLGHFSGNTIATGVDHLIYGWVFFGVVIMLMFMIGARWAEPELSVQKEGTLKGESDSDIPVSLSKSPIDASRELLFVGLVICAVVVAPVFVKRQLSSDPSSGDVLLVPPQNLAPQWKVSSDSVAEWTPQFQNPSGQFTTTYTSGPTSVGLYLGYYRNQNYNRKVVSSENVLVKSKDLNWAQVSSGSRSVELAGVSHSVRTAELRGTPVPGQMGEDRITVWQLYWINGTLTSSDTLAKAYGAMHRLLGRGDDSAVIILYTPKGSSNEGDATLATFLQTNAVAIDLLLQSVRLKTQAK